ncbi:hypothetical protein L9F63_021666, partial [Diploptera punctata]
RIGIGKPASSETSEATDALEGRPWCSAVGSLHRERRLKDDKIKGNQNGQGHPITGAVKREFRRPHGGRDRAALGGRQGNENSGYLSSR